MIRTIIHYIECTLSGRWVVPVIKNSIWVAVVLLNACSQPPRNSDGLMVVTTTGMIGDAVQNIIGDKGSVIALMGPGVDPHLYKATQGDLQKLTQADIIFYNGLHLEGKMGEVLTKLSRTKNVVALASTIQESSLRNVAEFEGTHDPHIWFDVMLWKDAIKSIATSLSSIDTTHAAYYTRRYEQYTQRLDSLHAHVTEQIMTIPEQQRVLITAHDAFGYFGDAYKIEVRGLQGISTMSEFGLRDVTDLVDFIIERKVKAIFIETSVPQRSIDAVITGCNKKGWPVKIGGHLYSDAMGQAETPAGTYIGMVQANVKTIVDALK